MQTTKPNLFLKYILPGALISSAFTAVIGLTAANLSGFQIVVTPFPSPIPGASISSNALNQFKPARIKQWQTN